MTASRTAVRKDLPPHLRRARDHIDTRYTQPLVLDEVAAVAGVSKYHFVRCFASAYGQTPIRYSPGGGSSERRTFYVPRTSR